MRKRGNLQGTLILFFTIQTLLLTTQPLKAENDLIPPVFAHANIFSNHALYTPTRISYGYQDLILAGEPFTNKINILLPDLSWQSAISVTNTPLCVARTADGKIIIGNPENGKVEIYTIQGQLIGTFEEPPEKIRMPNDIALDSNGFFHVVDSRGCMVHVFDPEGNFEFSFGSSGSATGQFNFPVGIAVMPDSGNLAVADQINGRVQIFDKNGSFLYTFGSIGAEDGQFMRIQGLTVDNSGRIYTVDSLLNRIQVFSSSGEYLTTLETPDSKQLRNIQDILIDKFNRVLVSSSGNGCIASWLLMDDGPENIIPVTPQSQSSPLSLFYDPAPMLQSLEALKWILGGIAEGISEFLIQFQSIYKIEMTALHGADADGDKILYEFGIFKDLTDEAPLYTVIARPKDETRLGQAAMIINLENQARWYWRVRSTDGTALSPWGCPNPMMPDLSIPDYIRTKRLY